MNISNEYWEVFYYEVQMYWAMTKIRSEIDNKNWEIVIGQSLLRPEAKSLAMNALIESKLIHIRVLAEILLSRGTQPDDIKLVNLYPNWQGNTELVDLVDELKSRYGKSKEENSPCWTINKRVAHFTSFRADSFNYASLFQKIDPPLKACIRKVAELGNKPEIVQLMDSVV